MKAYLTKTGATQYKPALSSLKRIIARDEYDGYCLACGKSQGGCEPDARKYVCESCGAAKVYGAEELLLMGLYH
jgi:Zn finger protein HypA/HybF involved in hydrogenase expression